MYSVGSTCRGSEIVQSASAHHSGVVARPPLLQRVEYLGRDVLVELHFDLQACQGIMMDGCRALLQGRRPAWLGLLVAAVAHFVQSSSFQHRVGIFMGWHGNNRNCRASPR